MLAMRLAMPWTGISYPYLYLNSAASALALKANDLASAIDPVANNPIEGVIWNKYDTVAGSNNLSGIFFCEINTAESFPVTPMDVMLAELMALNAYSTWYNLPSGEKIVMCLSKPAEPAC